MPCRDYDSDVCTVTVREDTSTTKKLVEAQKKKLNRYARMLCLACQCLEQFHKDLVTQGVAHAQDFIGEMSVVLDLEDDEQGTLIQLADWYEKHEKDDKAEKARVKDAALKKLTDAEKKALGLK